MLDSYEVLVSHDLICFLNDLRMILLTYNKIISIIDIIPELQFVQQIEDNRENKMLLRNHFNFDK